MKVALVYDRVNKWGGAERVLLALHKLYPEAPLFTLVHNPSSASWSSVFQVIPSFFNSVGFLRTRHELLAPFASLAFESFSFDEYDLVISITSAEAKSIITKPATLHLCYCLTPTRYLWSGRDEYLRLSLLRFIPEFIKKRLVVEDWVLSHRPDAYIAISDEVRGRINKYYQQKSDIIYPSIDDKFYSKQTVPFGDRSYYLYVGRLVGYKKADLVVNTFNQNKKKLIIVGTGNQWSKLRSLAKKNIQFQGPVSDERLINLYRNAKAVIFPQLEDFGLVPLEAQACGAPVIAYNAGGASETVLPRDTGIFFNEQSVLSLADAIARFEAGDHEITPEKCQKQAQKFREDRFIHQFSATVNTLWENYRKTLM